MRRLLLAVLWVAAGVTRPAAGAPQEVPPRDPPQALRVLSFNIRYGTADDGPDRWMLRRGLVVETILATRAHLVGLQEALAFQQDQILEGLEGYRAFGQGRKGGRLGEHVSVLVDTERLEVLGHGDFWLSDTPEEPGSRGWDAALPRMVTWLVLRDRVLDRRFAVLNTHFDHVGKRARLESARRVTAFARELAPLPILVLGDLNASEDSPPLRVLKDAGLRDTYRVVQPRAEDAGTYHAFRGVARGPKIDYVLCGPQWRVVAAEIVRRHEGGRYPSDHFPVLAVLELPRRPRWMPVVDAGKKLLVLPRRPREGGRRIDSCAVQRGADDFALWVLVRGIRGGRQLLAARGAGPRAVPWRPVDDPAPAPGLDLTIFTASGRTRWWITDRFGVWPARPGDDGRPVPEADTPLFAGPEVARAPSVLQDGTRWLCYYAAAAAPGGPVRVWCRSSRDLRTWSEPVAVQWGGRAGRGHPATAAPLVVRRDGLYYLFRTDSRWLPLTHVYRSADPLDFGKEGDAKHVGTLRIAAPELVEDRGVAWLCSVSEREPVVRLHRLRFVAEEETPRADTFTARFTPRFTFEDGTLQGFAGDRSVFGDSPRSAPNGRVRGRPVLPEGSRYVDSLAGGPQGRGVLRSPPFELPDGRITFLVGGSDDARKAYVAVVLEDGGEEILRAPGTGSPLLERVVFDVSAHAGRKARIVLVDRAGGRTGFIAFDDLRAETRPANRNPRTPR